MSDVWEIIKLEDLKYGFAKRIKANLSFADGIIEVKIRDNGLDKVKTSEKQTVRVTYRFKDKIQTTEFKLRGWFKFY